MNPFGWFGGWLNHMWVHDQLLGHVQLFATLWTIAARLLCPWDFPGKSTGVSCHFLFQGISPAQGLNSCLLHLLHWQADFSLLCHLWSWLSLIGTCKERNFQDNRGHPVSISGFSRFPYLALKPLLSSLYGLINGNFLLELAFRQTCAVCNRLSTSMEIKPSAGCTDWAYVTISFFLFAPGTCSGR